MPRTRLRRIRRLATLGVATAAVVRFAYGRRSARAHRPTNGKADWAPLAAVPTPARPAAPAPAPEPEVATPAAAPEPVAVADRPWVDPVDGACPLSHPVKGNANSGIYHVPGGRFYNQTIPERCYRDAAAAEADGMRASKR